jgi:hypothetical protein
MMDSSPIDVPAASSASRRYLIWPTICFLSAQ